MGAHRWATALVSSVICALITGCSGSPEPTTEGSVSGDPSGPPASSVTSLTTPPDPDEPPAPVMPDLAKQNSIAGAKAFVRYYIDVLNYAFSELQPTRLDALSPAGCGLCRSFVGGVRKLRRNGGSQIGGTWSTSNVAGLGSDDASTFFVADVDARRGTSYASPDAPGHRILPDHLEVIFQLRRADAGWRIEVVYPG
jgi:hypothetical protein